MADIPHLTLLAAYQSAAPLDPAQLQSAVAEQAPDEHGLGERIAAALTYWTHEGLLERADPHSEQICVPPAQRQAAEARLRAAGLLH